MIVTHEQYKQLEAIILLNPSINYLARDKDGSLWGYNEIPTKESSMWLSNPYTRMPNGLLPFITWDTEPFDINEGIAQYEDSIDPEELPYKFCPDCGKAL